MAPLCKLVIEARHFHGRHVWRSPFGRQQLNAGETTLRGGSVVFFLFFWARKGQLHASKLGPKHVAGGMPQDPAASSFSYSQQVHNRATQLRNVSLPQSVRTETCPESRSQSKDDLLAIHHVLCANAIISASHPAEPVCFARPG